MSAQRSRRSPRARPRSKKGRAKKGPVAPTATELRALAKALDRRLGANAAPPSVKRRASRAVARWNPDPEDVQRSVAQLVLTLVEFLRELMERQAIRRMEHDTLTSKEIEAVGLALMRLEDTIRDVGRRFGLKPEDLNLDLGPIKLV
jgi:hypothetical protein